MVVLPVKEIEAVVNNINQNLIFNHCHFQTIEDIEEVEILRQTEGLVDLEV